MPRTPDEIDDAISRSVPLSPATPRLRVAVPSPAHPVLIPTSTSVTSTLMVSTLTASSIIPLTPDPSGTAVVEKPHPPVVVLFKLRKKKGIWYTDKNTGHAFVIWAIVGFMPAMILGIICIDIYTRCGAPRVAIPDGQKEAEAAPARQEEAKEKNNDEDKMDDGGASREKKSSFTDATVMAKPTPPPPVSFGNSWSSR
ncbi:hypothetical protein QC762_0087830 [Podospora pseudocomata]|uniref:Transmembrane protein n=1 Tax=Podospora pseudocomata TaxID=2093779 RepID=A0ABR0GDM0_9PEZI|nr:hypothetical protein QC762_0087830 [Podospora pseudocomata]